MKAVLWTSLFWILVVAWLGIYTKWFNSQWAQVVSEFVYEQDVGTGETELDEESVAAQLMIINTKLDAALWNSMEQETGYEIEEEIPSTTTTPPTPEEVTIDNLEARIKELEAKQSSAE